MLEQLRGSLKGKMNAWSGLDEDLVSVSYWNVFKHMNQDELAHLGQLVSFHVDRWQSHVVTTFENGYIIVYKMVDPNESSNDDEESRTES